LPSLSERPQERYSVGHAEAYEDFGIEDSGEVIKQWEQKFGGGLRRLRIGRHFGNPHYGCESKIRWDGAFCGDINQKEFLYIFYRTLLRSPA